MNDFDTKTFNKDASKLIRELKESSAVLPKHSKTIADPYFLDKTIEGLSVHIQALEKAQLSESKMNGQVKTQLLLNANTSVTRCHDYMNSVDSKS